MSEILYHFVISMSFTGCAPGLLDCSLDYTESRIGLLSVHTIISKSKDISSVDLIRLQLQFDNFMDDDSCTSKYSQRDGHRSLRSTLGSGFDSHGSEFKQALFLSYTCKHMSCFQ